MFIRYHTVKALSRLIQRIHTFPPWQDPRGFFSVLHEVIPFDYSVGFIKLDPITYRFVPFAYTLSNGGGTTARRCSPITPVSGGSSTRSFAGS